MQHLDAQATADAPAVSPMTAVWVATVLFSTGPVAVAASSLSGPAFSFWRLWAGLPILVALTVWSSRHAAGRPDRRGWQLAGVGGVAFGIHQVCFMSALKATTVVDVTLMNTLAPIVVAVLAVPMFGERPGLAFRAWSLLAIAGGAGIAVLGSTGIDGNPVGIALAVANIIFYAVYFVLSKQARDHIGTWPFLLGALAAAALVVSAFVLLSGERPWPVDGADLVLCAFVALVPGALGHGAMTWSLRFVPANIPPVVMLAIPLFSGLMAWVVVGQTVTVAKVVMGAVTLFGVLGAVRSPAAPVIALEALDHAEET